MADLGFTTTFTAARTAAMAAALAATIGLAALRPAKTVIDLPLALAIAGLGVLIVVTPSLVPGLSPPM